MLRFFVWSVALSLIPAPTVRADFQLRDGDVVAFLGDSITAERTYTKVVENYTLLRFPDRKVRFINAGRGGDTAQRSLARLDREVLDLGATVVIVALGINDIGWGTKADAEHQQAYLDGIRSIIERCQARKARVYIASAAITNENHDRGESEVLQTMGDRAMALARDMGERSIDIQRSMRAIHRNVRRVGERTEKKEDRPTLHTKDGIHLSELGQVAMAFAVLKGLDAPAEVSSAIIDAANPTQVEAVGCQVRNVAKDGDRLTFDRLDVGLPINFGALGALRFGYVPVGDELNRYMLTIRNLPAGRYDIAVDGRGLGHFAADALADGVNIASATSNGWEPGGPWEAKAWVLGQLTNSRSEIAEAYRNLRDYLPDGPEMAKAREQFEATNVQLIADQQAVARPRPFRFVVTPHVDTRKEKDES